MWKAWPGWCLHELMNDADELAPPPAPFPASPCVQLALPGACISGLTTRRMPRPACCTPQRPAPQLKDQVLKGPAAKPGCVSPAGLSCLVITEGQTERALAASILVVFPSRRPAGQCSHCPAREQAKSSYLPPGPAAPDASAAAGAPRPLPRAAPARPRFCGACVADSGMCPFRFKAPAASAAT